MEKIFEKTATYLTGRILFNSFFWNYKVQGSPYSTGQKINKYRYLSAFYIF